MDRAIVSWGSQSSVQPNQANSRTSEQKVEESTHAGHLLQQAGVPRELRLDVTTKTYTGKKQLRQAIDTN